MYQHNLVGSLETGRFGPTLWTAQRLPHQCGILHPPNGPLAIVPVTRLLVCLFGPFAQLCKRTKNFFFQQAAVVVRCADRSPLSQMVLATLAAAGWAGLHADAAHLRLLQQLDGEGHVCVGFLWGKAGSAPQCPSRRSHTMSAGRPVGSRRWGSPPGRQSPGGNWEPVKTKDSKALKLHKK